MNTYPTCDFPFRDRCSAAPRSVTEIVLKSLFLRVNRSPFFINYGFHASAKAIQYRVNITLVARK